MLSLTPFPTVFVGDGIVEEDPVEWLRQVRLFALGRPETDKVKVFELCLAPGSPAEGWYDSQNPDKSFKSLCQSFQKEFPGVQYAPLPAWLPLERLETCMLREEDLGREIEEEGTGLFLPSHVVYARRIQKLAAAVPEPEMQLVANARHRLPAAVKACIPKGVKSWEAYVDALLAINTFDIVKAHERIGGGGGGNFDVTGNGLSIAPPPLHRHGSSSASRSRFNSVSGGGEFPAPHIAYAGPLSNGINTSLPANISSGSERGDSPLDYRGPNSSYNPSPTSSATRFGSSRNGPSFYPSASPYDRDTPSAPPMSSTRTWLATGGGGPAPNGLAGERSPTGSGGSNGSVGRSAWVRT